MNGPIDIIPTANGYAVFPRIMDNMVIDWTQVFVFKELKDLTEWLLENYEK